MKKYDPDGKCAKCGGGDVKSEHYDADSDYVMGMVRCFNPEAKRNPERINRKCENCGYEWGEAPLDETTSFQASEAAQMASPTCEAAKADSTPPPRINDLVKRCKGRGCDSKSPCRVISAIEPIVVRSTVLSCHCMHMSEKFHLIERAPETIQLCNSTLTVKGAGAYYFNLMADIIGIASGKYGITLTKKEDTKS